MKCRLFAITVVLAVTLPAGAAVEEKADMTDAPTAQFDSMLETTQSSTLGLMSEAEADIRLEHYDRAIEFIKRAMPERCDDLDLHKIYAEALEGKYFQQDERKRDANLLEQCVKEWLIVMRSEVGDEKGLNVKGVGGLGDFLYKDDEHYILAQHHLIELTGKAPRGWESDNRYLKRVLTPSKSVRAVLMQK